MFQGTDDAQLHECENCGAQLPPPDANGTRTCQFCHSTYTAAPRAAAAPPQVNIVFAPTAGTPGAAPTYVAPEFNPINADESSSSKSGCGCGGVTLFVLLILGLTVGIPLYIEYKNGNLRLPGHPSYNFGDTAVPLPGEPGRPTQFITTASHYDGSKTVWEVLKSNGVDSSATWATAVTGTSQPALAADGSLVYVADETRLTALKLSDGTQAWQATLSDEYTKGFSCTECFLAFPGRIVIKTKDDNLQAFDAATGAKVWNRELESGYDTLLRTAGHVVVQHAKEGDSFAKDFQSLDPSTGAPVATIDPVCTDPQRPQSSDHAGSSFAAQRSATYPEGLYFAFGSNPGCFQLWDAATGTMAWNTNTPDDNYSFTSGFGLVEGADGTVLVTTREQIALVAPGGAAFTPIVSSKDVTYWPIALDGTNAIVQATSQKGTTKTSVQAFGPDGTKKWEVALGKAASIDPGTSSSITYNTNSDGTYTAHVDGGKLFILMFVEGSSKNHTLQLQTYDAATGKPAPMVSLDPNNHDLIPSYGPATWQGSRVLVRVGDSTMQEIDAAAGTTLYVLGN